MSRRCAQPLFVHVLKIENAQLSTCIRRSHTRSWEKDPKSNWISPYQFDNLSLQVDCGRAIPVNVDRFSVCGLPVCRFAKSTIHFLLSPSKIVRSHNFRWTQNKVDCWLGKRQTEKRPTFTGIALREYQFGFSGAVLTPVTHTLKCAEPSGSRMWGWGLRADNLRFRI